MDPFNAEFNRLLVSTYKSVMKVEELMLRDLSNSDLSISEMHMLESIGKADDAGAHMTSLAQDQGITMPSVTTSVQRLERKGYVTKQRNAFDARMVRVKLTDKGRRAEVAHRYFHRKMVRAISGEMNPEERRILLAGLVKLNAFLNKRIEIESERAQGAEGGDRI